MELSYFVCIPTDTCGCLNIDTGKCSKMSCLWSRSPRMSSKLVFSFLINLRPVHCHFLDQLWCQSDTDLGERDIASIVFKVEQWFCFLQFGFLISVWNCHGHVLAIELTKVHLANCSDRLLDTIRDISCACAWNELSSFTILMVYSSPSTGCTKCLLFV